jgi:acetyl-CoA carboxylase carboxyltransferase component
MFGFNAGGGSYLPRQGSFHHPARGQLLRADRPGVVKSVLGEDVTPDDLGGPKVHGASSGVADLTVPTRSAPCAPPSRLLSYLPGHNRELAPFQSDERSRSTARPRPRSTRCCARPSTSPTGFNTPFDVTLIIQQICDHGDYFEVQPGRARNAITAFGRIGGHVVGFVANNSAVASGQIDIAAAMTRSRGSCASATSTTSRWSSWKTPRASCPAKSRRMGIVHAGRAMLDAIIDVRTPRILLIVRNAFGGAYASFNNYPTGADVVLALPVTRASR